MEEATLSDIGELGAIARIGLAIFLQLLAITIHIVARRR